MKVIELLRSKEWSGKVVDCVLRFALACALAGAQVFGGYAPLALGMTAASGAGVRGLSALVGASVGAFLFLPFTHALRTFAAGVLIFTANNAFFDLKLYKKRAFLPLLCAGMMFSVEFVYVLRDGVGEAANCLIALLLASLGTMSARALLAPEIARERAHWGGSEEGWNEQVDALRANIADDYAAHTVRNLCDALGVGEEERMEYFGF